MTKRKRVQVDEDPLADLRREIRREGARDAFEALREVCQDKAAPANARATAGTTILRAAGLFEKSDDDDDKEAYQMTAAKLARKIARLEVAARRPTNSGDAPDEDDGDDAENVFG